MFLTRVLFKKVKSKKVLVQLESVVSGHRINLVRERLAEKFEFVKFDPWIQRESLYKEKKRIRSVN